MASLDCIDAFLLHLAGISQELQHHHCMHVPGITLSSLYATLAHSLGQGQEAEARREWELRDSDCCYHSLCIALSAARLEPRGHNLISCGLHAGCQLGKLWTRGKMLFITVGAHILLDVIADGFLHQMVIDPTRGNAVLDLASSKGFIKGLGSK